MEKTKKNKQKFHVEISKDIRAKMDFPKRK
jgi:hypothetical protein